MNLGRLSINQPILAMVLSIVLLIVGAIAYTTLPVAEYPQVAPPTVVVNATYAGASAEVIAATVATPIEQEINGVDNMLYVVSQSTGDGVAAISVVFKPGTNIDFIGRWRIAVAFSLAVILAGGVGLATRGFRLGIDFAGGAEVHIRFTGGVRSDEGAVRAVVSGSL